MTGKGRRDFNEKLRSNNSSMSLFFSWLLQNARRYDAFNFTRSTLSSQVDRVSDRQCTCKHYHSYPSSTSWCLAFLSRNSSIQTSNHRLLSLIASSHIFIESNVFFSCSFSMYNRTVLSHLQWSVLFFLVLLDIWHSLSAFIISFIFENKWCLSTIPCQAPSSCQSIKSSRR